MPEVVCGIKLSLRMLQRKNPKRSPHDFTIRKEERIVCVSLTHLSEDARRSHHVRQPICDGSADRYTAGPVTEVGNGPVMTYLRRKSNSVSSPGVGRHCGCYDDQNNKLMKIKQRHDLPDHVLPDKPDNTNSDNSIRKARARDQRVEEE